MKCNICKNKMWFWQESITFRGRGTSHQKCIEDAIINKGVIERDKRNQKAPL